MNEQFNDGFVNDMPPEPVRPAFLKVLCILTFVGAGLMILVYLIGSLTLVMGEESMNMLVEKIQEANIDLKIDDTAAFLTQFGRTCLLALITNIFTIVGAAMMWNLNKIGFFIYAAAEIAANFLGMDMSAGVDGAGNSNSIGFSLFIDLVFIVMYALNLKYMNKNKNTTA